MLEKTIFLIAAFLGFTTILLIGFRHNSKKHTNFYLIIAFILGSFRFLVHGLYEILPSIEFQKQADFIFFIFFWPLMYLYFKRLNKNSNYLLIKDFFHLLISSVLLLLIFTYNFETKDEILIVRKVATVITIILNAVYAIASFKLLRDTIWKRSSKILVINQQNIIIKKWTQLLFYTFSIMLIRFYICMLMNERDFGYVNQNYYFWIGAVIWIFVCIKILISPEFLYGYDIFQDKIDEYNKNTIVFNHIWTKNSKQIINIQDTVLKDKIEGSLQNYILAIENVALNTDLFFNENFKIIDLANNLNFPKSHFTYLFKYHSSVSFSDFKKIIRIQKAVVLINEGFLKTNTLEALANHLGFSSYSPFFKSFKSITGVSPQEYTIN